MTDENKCKYRGCTLPWDVGCLGACILHYDSADKDATLFKEKLEDKIRTEEEGEAERIDLDGVVFPDGVHFNDMVFKKAVSFSGARFVKRAIFGFAEFRGGAFFGGAEFRGEANFSGAKFGGLADFSGSEFHGGAYFWGSEFHGVAYFLGAKFHGEAHFAGAKFDGRAVFINAEFGGAAEFHPARLDLAAESRPAEFHGEANFLLAAVGGALDFRDVKFPDKDSKEEVLLSGLRMGSAGTVRLEGVDLARVSLLRTDVTHFSFVGCTWPKIRERRLWIPFVQKQVVVIYDELTLDDPGKTAEKVQEEIPLVADVYRQLRINYEANKQEIEAGEFYIGQMEMRRRDLGFPPLYRGLLTAYRFIAMYGESYVRPLCFYFAVACVWALFYLWGGFEANGRVVRYGWRPDLANTISFIQDYGRALFLYALTAGAFLRSEIKTSSSWVPLVQYGNMLVNILLITLFVVALRRKFHR